MVPPSGSNLWIKQLLPLFIYSSYAHAPVDGSASKEGNCANRVFRSGSFLTNPYMQRFARRGAPYPSPRRGRNYLGFRVAKTLD
jgi:formylglycine-generating enzyme required for sulfatase activity